MDREIKFRAWDTERGEMVCLEDYVDHYWYYGDILNPDSTLFEVMQYTGLKDKNGQEIYEGDILEEELISGKKEKFAVRFIEGSFVAESPDEMYLLENIHELAEVIGSKSENPDMAINPEELKGGQK